MKVFRSKVLEGNYDLRILDEFGLQGATALKTGLVRIAAGTRSPSEGLKSSAKYEVAYLVEGSLTTWSDSEEMSAKAGDVLVAGPDEAHATLAVDDVVIFFALFSLP